MPAHLLLGGVYAHRGRYDEAFVEAERVLRLSDLEPRAHLLIGMIAARRGRPREAVQALRRALYLDDSLALAHFWLEIFTAIGATTEELVPRYQNVVQGWDQHTLEITEMFASDLNIEQLVDYCRRSSKTPALPSDVS